jgi:hypothetical protein
MEYYSSVDLSVDLDQMSHQISSPCSERAAASANVLI